MIAIDPRSKLRSRPLRPRAQPLKSRLSPLRQPAEGITDQTERNEVAARAAAMLPAELLQPSELIILLLKPSAWFIVLAPLKALAILAALTAAAAGAGGENLFGVGRHEIILVGMAVIGLRLFWQFLEWLSRVYILTDQRVIRVKGVIRVNVFETSLRQIRHTQLLLPLRERLFGLGTVAFATAGTGFTEAFWNMVARPLEVHQKIVQTVNRYRR